MAASLWNLNFAMLQRKSACAGSPRQQSSQRADASDMGPRYIDFNRFESACAPEPTQRRRTLYIKFCTAK